MDSSPGGSINTDQKLRLCIFCYRSASTAGCLGGLDDCSRFLKFLERFVFRGEDELNGKLVETWEKNEYLVCCEDCGVIISSFCEVYHQVKCLELQLEWKLGSLVDIMNLAGRVPSRTIQFRRMMEETKQEDSFSTFRNAVLRKCIGSYKLSNSKPRVLLKRKLGTRTVDSQNNSSSQSPLSEAMNARTSIDGNDKDRTTMTNSNSSAFELFLGWFLSIVSVVTLTTAPQPTWKVEASINSSSLPEEIVDFPTETDNFSESPALINVDDSIVALKKEHSKDVRKPAGFIENKKMPSKIEVERVNAAVEYDDWLNNDQFDPLGSPSVSELEENNEEPLENMVPVQEDPSQNTVQEKEMVIKTEPQPSASTSPDHLSKQHKETQDIHTSSTTRKRTKRHLKNLDLKGHSIAKKKKAVCPQAEAPITPVTITTSSESTADELPTETKVSLPILESPPRRYNLREKRKSCYQQTEEDEDHNESDKDNSYTSDKDISSPIESDISYSSSCSPSSSESEDDQNSDEEMSEKGTPRKNTDNLESICSKDGCEGKFVDKEHFTEHSRLHAPAQYKCNFCEVVEENVIKLCEHERNLHSSPEGEIIRCPRCIYETKYPSHFKYHFAGVHIPGFEFFREFLSRTEFKNHWKCEVCKLSILLWNKKGHFRRLHDTKGVKPQDILKCPVEGCPAYFVKTRYKACRRALATHMRKIHRLTASKDKEVEESTEETWEAKDKCNTCSKTFPDCWSLRNHMKRCHLGNPSIFRCPVGQCEEEFNTEKGLENHHKLHGTFTCKFCDTVKEYAPELALHESEEHSIRANDTNEHNKKCKKFRCSRCPSDFSMKGRFYKHFLTTHMDLSRPANICHICQAEGSRRFLNYHIREFHNTEGLDPSKIIRCDKCPAYFVKPRQLYIHTMITHYKKTCPKCGKYFRRLKALRSHMKIRHPELPTFETFAFACNSSCGRMFETKEMLDRHRMDAGHEEQVVEEPTSVQCSKCGKEFQNKFRLAIHESNVHGEERFICPECGKGFKAKRTLKLHMAYHEGPDTWKEECPTCQKKFVDKYKLSDHMRTHTKEKPYVCQFCGEKYAHRHNWRNHVKTKHADEIDHLDEEIMGRKRDVKNMVSRKGTKKGDFILARVQRK